MSYEWEAFVVWKYVWMNKNCGCICLYDHMCVFIWQFCGGAYWDWCVSPPTPRYGSHELWQERGLAGSGGERRAPVRSWRSVRTYPGQGQDTNLWAPVGSVQYNQILLVKCWPLLLSWNWYLWYLFASGFRRSCGQHDGECEAQLWSGHSVCPQLPNTHTLYSHTSFN